MNRKPRSSRLPEKLFIIGCEGKNQERIYFQNLKRVINRIENRKYNVNFNYAEPFGGDPLCVVDRTIHKSIGKKNKASIFDYDGKTAKFEEAINLANVHNVNVGYSNYCFDLWLILHKEDYVTVVKNQNDYEGDVKRVYNLPQSTNIKHRNTVRRICDQLDLASIVKAIKRFERLEPTLNRKRNVTTSESVYYSNPDTSMPKLLRYIFNEAGLKAILN